MMDERTRSQVIRRLNYVAGHVQGIRKMTEADRYCVDILKQSFAVRKSLERIEAMILEGHLRTCVVDGIKANETARVVGELMDLYTQANR